MIGQPTCDKGESGIEKAAPVTDQPGLSRRGSLCGPKVGFSQTKASAVLASTPEAAKQAAQAQVQANKLKGDWCR